MKKFVILLLAVASFCRELNVSDLDGNEIKFELKDSTLFENGKKIGEYNKTSAASIILTGSDGVEADFKAVRAKNLNEFKEYIFSDEGGIKVVKFSAKSQICEAFNKKEAVNLAAKVKKEAQNDIANIEKGYKEQKEFEERKMTKGVVNEILSDIFSSDSLKVDQKELVNIILKKVS